MSNPWDHLPNAKHIDAILASAKAHPKEWSAAWDSAWDSAWGAAWGAACSAARNVAWGAVRDMAWDAVRNAARDAAWGAARDAIISLIVYDDCAYMLNSNPCELEILAKFGDERAILLLPACKAFAAINKIHTPVIA